MSKQLPQNLGHKPCHISLINIYSAIENKIVKLYKISLVTFQT